MKALRLHAARDVRLDDVPEPVPGPGQVQVAVHWCGICGSDLGRYEHGPRTREPHPLTGESLPIILGHEFAGEVVQAAPDVTDLAVGDRVAVEPILNCGECAHCLAGRYNLCARRGYLGLSGLSGGLSELAVVAAGRAHRLPPHVPTDVGALVEPMAVAWHALGLTAVAGRSVVIAGGGPIGLSALLAARAMGARHVGLLELSAVRRDGARALGATAVVDPGAEDPAAILAALDLPDGADVTVDAAGNPHSLRACVECTRAGGTLLAVGLWHEEPAVDMQRVVGRELSIVGSAAYTRADYARVIDFVAQEPRLAERLITARLALADTVERGFEALTGPQGAAQIKILVSPRA
jgi:(R,R)-butanediol dehydrogenase / meso-butanediol dehydrogenase / diacetyl reductase